MKRSDTKAVFYIIKQLMRECPVGMVADIIDGILINIRPFITAYMTGLFIDASLNGESKETLIRYAWIGVSAVLVVSIIDSIAVEIYHKYIGYASERQIGSLAYKSMIMDYEYLENSDVHGKKEAICSYASGWGLFGMTMDAVTHFFRCATTIIAAVVVVIPKMVSCFIEQNTNFFAIFFAVLFFLGIIMLSILNVKIMRQYSQKLTKIYDEKRVPVETRKRFYMNLFAKADSQKDIRMCGQKPIVDAEFSKMKEKMEDYKKDALKVTAKAPILTDSLSGLIMVLVYLFTGIYGFSGYISIGSAVVFATCIREVSEYMFNVGGLVGQLKEIAIYANKYMDFMELEQKKHEGTIPVEKRRDNKFSVEFDHVSFKYPGATDYVIKDLSLKFEIGEKMAIVGRNGSGKTTFIKLLCRLYDVTDGCIKVNGIDIRKYDYKEYCNLFGVIFQDFAIFDFPLGEVLAGNEKYNSEKAIDALNRAGLAGHFEMLENGLDTFIGQSFNESGVNFSGGEKQKIAIARAIYKDAPFVIMDEPTAALDPEAEAEVFEGFDKMVGKKTAIYISHRLASCKFCEDILVFDKGKVVQHGTHEELEKQDGLYRKLWHAQAQYYA